MTEKYEQMSAFMDGEPSADGIVDSLKNEAELSDAWARYHLSRSIMRKELVKGPLVDVSASVAAALESEVNILAPKQSKGMFAKMSGKLIPFAKQSGQYAIAASVAAAVIIGVQTYNRPDQSEPFTSLPTGDPIGGLVPVSLNQTREIPSQERQDVREVKRQIQALINDHEHQLSLKSSKPVDSELEQEGESNK